MDIARPERARARRIRRAIYAGTALVVLVGVTLGLSRLRPAAPTVDSGTLWFGTVKRGDMLRQMRGLGTLVPEDIRWIAAQSQAHVDRIVLRSGAVVKPDSVILEMSDPQLERDALDAEYQLKAVEADYANLKVQLETNLLNQKTTAAQIEGDYQQAKLQAEVDQQLASEGLLAGVNAKLSKVKADQLGIQTKLAQQRLAIDSDAAKAQLAAQQARVEQMRALHNLRRSQVEALHVRAGINGVLQQVAVEEGQQVTLGQNLARVADPKRLKATIQIAETQAKDVALGQKASIDTRNGVVAGHVSRIDAAVVNGTVAVDVTFDGPLPQGARPDLSVDGTIEIENLRNVLYVERPVHGEANSTVGLFKAVPETDEAVRVQVKLGRASVNTIEVVQGLKEGDRIVLSDMSAWDNVDRIRLK